MRMLFTAAMSTEKFNAACRDGTAGAKIAKILEAIKPEAAYFIEDNGVRTAVLVVDLKDAAQIPALAEPWFLTFDAVVKLRPCMTPGDLKNAGLEELAKKWG